MQKRPSSVNPADYPDEEFQLFSINAFDLGHAPITPGSSIGSTKKLVQPGDVLLSKIVPHIRRAWIVGPEIGYRQVGSSEWITFRNELAHPPYLRHLLTSNLFHAHFMNAVAGVGGSLLRARPAAVGKIEILLPPIVEQERIADILDRADDLRAKRQAALDKLDSLTQAIFHDMFENRGAGEEGYEPVTLGEICEFKYGKSLPAKNRAGGDVPVFGSNGIVGNHDAAITDGPAIVVGRKGSFGAINFSETACWPIDTAYFIDSTATDTDLKWLSVLLGRLRLDELNKAAAVPGLNREDAYRKKVVLPPVSVQCRFADLVQRIDLFSGVMERGFDAHDSLMASLQQRAFSGAL